jgi:hypothetical protein
VLGRDTIKLRFIRYALEIIVTNKIYQPFLDFRTSFAIVDSLKTDVAQGILCGWVVDT